MQKQIKNSLTIKALVLALGTFGSGVLCADWGSQSLDDRVDWLVNHGEELTGYELDKRMSSLSEEGKENFISLLSNKINWAVDRGQGLTKSDVYNLRMKIAALPDEYQREFTAQLSDEAAECIAVKSFELNPGKYPIDTDAWWHLSDRGQKKCFELFSGQDQARIREMILAGDLDFKVHYFQYLFESDQKSIFAEVEDPHLKALCFGHFCAREQALIWAGLNSYLKALCFKYLHRSLRQKFFFDLDEATQKQYLAEHHQPSKVRFQSELPGY